MAPPAAVSLDRRPAGGCRAFELFCVVDQLASAADTGDHTIFGYGVSGFGLARVLRRPVRNGENKAAICTSGVGSYIISAKEFTGKHILSGLWDDDAVTTEYAWFDGEFIGHLAPDPPTDTSTTATVIGGSTNAPALTAAATINGRHFTATTPLTAEERDLLTGWLAFDSGIQSELVDGHPYKNATFV